MRLSKDFFYTIKENISDEDSTSGKLLVKSGMIKKIGNGIYAKMPLGEKVNLKNFIKSAAIIVMYPIGENYLYPIYYLKILTFGKHQTKT